MKPPPIEDVLRTLRAVRARMLAQSFLAALAKGALLLGGALVAAGAVRRWVFGELPWSGTLAVGAAAAMLALVLVWSFVRRRSLPQAAAAIDRLGGTHDRFVSALAFAGDGDATEPRQLALRECVEFIRRGKFSQLVRLRVPGELAWLLVPAVALFFLQWEASGTFGARDALAAKARESVEETAQQLEELARQAEQQPEQEKTEELKRLAEELKRSAKQIRAEAKTTEEAEKAALRELSELEKLVQEMQKPSGLPTAEELRELAKALEKNEATQEAAQAMQAGDLAKAAEQLEKAMQELAEKGDRRSQEEIDQALKEALEKMAEQKLSEALKQLAQQMREQAGKGGEGQQMPKELADLLKKLAQQQLQQGGQKPQQGGKPLDPQALQNLLAALQNLKFGEGKGEPSGNPQPGKGGTIAMQNFSPGSQPGGQDGDPRLPGGQPGSERDTGTTENPFGKNPGELAKEGANQSLSGRLGDGETLQQFLPSAGDTSQSRRRYKELYEAMAPAAQDAVVQENIPLGSRFLIKRYFESIRPRE